MLTKIPSPICVLNVDSFIDEQEKFIFKTMKDFDVLKEDEYLLRHIQIDFLKKNDINFDKEYWDEFYTGNLSESEIMKSVSLLSSEQLSEYSKIVPTRYRAMSSFAITKSDNDLIVERVSNSNFSQNEALIQDNSQDLRLNERVFNDFEGEINKGIIEIIKKISMSIFENHPTKVKSINLSLHHTKIITDHNNQATNSPEGIHQDGMDYIVSALVIYKNNATGGESIIYGADKETEILRTTLSIGQAIFQPDLNTDLWHTVTPIRPIDVSKPAERYTLGFDFQVNT